MYEQFFLHFFKLILKQPKQKLFLQFLCFHIIIIISITISIILKSNFTKDRRMYEHVYI